MNDTPRIRTVLGCTLLAVTVTAGTAACSGPDDHPLTVKAYDAADQLAVSAPADGAKADPEKPLEITAKGDEGRITDVTAVDASGRHLAGELTADGRRWRSTATLAAGARYTVRVATEDKDGAPGARTFTFETAPAKRALTAAFGPEAGTYGVGQPITAELSLPVKDRASRAIVERALKVRSTPSVEGSWYWVDDKKLHFRPKEYWPAGATVTAVSYTHL